MAKLEDLVLGVSTPTGQDEPKKGRRSAVGGSECEGGAAVAGGSARDEGADPGSEWAGQDC